MPSLPKFTSCELGDGGKAGKVSLATGKVLKSTELILRERARQSVYHPKAFKIERRGWFGPGRSPGYKILAEPLKRVDGVSGFRSVSLFLSFTGYRYPGY
jgi:hypothetical protein